MDIAHNEKGLDYSSLMSRRIRHILLVCNSYDSYALEEDGRIEARIQQEYSELNLSNPPAISRVESPTEALALVEQGEQFDLVMTMYNVGTLDVFTFAEQMKSLQAATPIVLLTNSTKEIHRRISENRTTAIDYIFCWNNSADLIIAIIKLLEDSMNAEHDILEMGVQAIMLVVFANVPEDNPFMAGAFHGVGEAETVINVGVSGPGVVSSAIKRAGNCNFSELADVIKKTAFKITRMGQLVATEASKRLDVPFGIVDLSLAPTPAVGDSVATS